MNLAPELKNKIRTLKNYVTAYNSFPHNKQWFVDDMREKVVRLESELGVIESVEEE